MGSHASLTKFSLSPVLTCVGRRIKDELAKKRQLASLPLFKIGLQPWSGTPGETPCSARTEVNSFKGHVILNCLEGERWGNTSEKEERSFFQTNAPMATGYSG